MGKHQVGFNRAVKRDEARLRDLEHPLCVARNGYRREDYFSAVRLARKWIRIAKKLRRQHTNDLEELGVFAPEHQPGYTLKRC